MKTKLLQRLFLPLLLLLSLSPSAHAQASAVSSGDTAWMLVASALVLMMTLPGLGLLYGGLARRENALSVLIQCLGITAVISLLWFVCGFSLVFGSGALIGGFEYLFLNNLDQQTLVTSIPVEIFVLFQMTFAIITPVLIVGAYAERTRFSAVLLFSSLWLLLVYCPIAHWVWGGGWLAELGVVDFAGGLVIHLCAGASALVAALVIGPRHRFAKGEPTIPHSMVMAFAGIGLLWVGWFGFNGGSALVADGQAANAMLATQLAAAAGALGWMAIEWYRQGSPGGLGAITGIIAGLGAVTPGSGFIGPIGAVVIGFSAGVACYCATVYCKQKLRIDDSMDVFPVHGIAGILGTLLLAVFALESLGGTGVPGGNTVLQQFGVQGLGVVSVLVYSMALSYVALLITKRLLGGLRVSESEEAQGLDLRSHHEQAYN